MMVDGRLVRVRRKRIKNLYLRISAEDASIVVSAPMRTSEAAIAAFVRAHHEWIDRQEHRIRTQDREALQWTPELRSRAAGTLNAALPELLERWRPIVGKGPSRITIRTMTTRWGSCTPRTGRIRLNLQLGLMDRRLLEYVFVHELTHLWSAGHGADFQRHMDRYLPQWRSLRRELNCERVRR